MLWHVSTEAWDAAGNAMAFTGRLHSQGLGAIPACCRAAHIGWLQRLSSTAMLIALNQVVALCNGNLQTGKRQAYGMAGRSFSSNCIDMWYACLLQHFLASCLAYVQMP
jgi:hypothetical protein